MATPLTRTETATLAEVLQALLDRVEEGDLRSTAGTVQRIEGAIKALEIVLGEAELSELEVPIDGQPPA
jgi:hypothetical protein